MKRRYGKCLLLFLFSLILLIVNAHQVQADLAAQEIDLGAWPYEANLDNQGMLWVSHSSPSEIWAINTSNGEITIYPVGGTPSDARGDGTGMLWWVDYDANQLSRLETTTNQLDTWGIPGSSGLYTTAIDSAGKVWAMDKSNPTLYRLDPISNQLCSYTIPDEGKGTYIEEKGENVWFGDDINDRILELDPVEENFTFWSLPGSNNPFDLVFDSEDILWFSDYSQDQIVSLDMVYDQITAYDLPPDHYAPEMVSIAKGEVWFDFEYPGGFGKIDPQIADSTTTAVSQSTISVSPNCQTLETPCQGKVKESYSSAK